MYTPKPILSFADASMVRRMPTAFRELAGHGYLVNSSEENPRLSYRVSWIGDWWFTSISSHDQVHVKTELGVHPPRDYALITLPLAGNSAPKMRSRVLGQAGCVTLARWNDAYEFENSGLFHYLVAHIPCDYLEGAESRYDMDIGLKVVSAYHGSGLVLAASLRALAQAGETRDRQAERALRELLPDCARLVRTVLRQPATSGGYSERSTRMARIRDYLEEHFRDPFLHSDQVADACGLSRRQLYREFSEAGESFAQILRELRIQKAAVELAGNTRVSISEVAYRCGFIKMATFTKAFREIHGCTPREFARKL